VSLRNSINNGMRAVDAVMARSGSRQAKAVFLAAYGQYDAKGVRC
jgi:hypothetical protein